MKHRRLVAYGAVALALLMATPALARSSNISGSIELAGSAVAAQAADGGGMTYGDYARFDTVVEGRMTNNSRLYISLKCSQDGWTVYQWSGDVDFSYPLADQAGEGLQWDGNAASCEARLIYRTYKGKKFANTTLDRTMFEVVGASR